MKTLELKHVAPYLEYDLKGFCTKKTINKITVANKIFIIDSIIKSNQFKYWTYDKSFVSQFNFLGKGFRSCDFKLILRPLSDYKKFPDIMDEFSEADHDQLENAFFVLGRSVNCLDFINYTQAELFFKYKIDLFDLINAGLAVDVNTLETNPYK